MGFNYEREKRLFIKEWKKLLTQYRAAGFSEEGIREMLVFDWGLFKQRRVYTNRSQPLPDEVAGYDSTDIKGTSTNLFKKFSSLSSRFDESGFEGRFDWILAVDDPALAVKLAMLSDSDKELLTLLVFDGFTQTEIAELQGCSQQSVSKKIKRIKIFLS